MIVGSWLPDAAELPLLSDTAVEEATDEPFVSAPEVNDSRSPAVDGRGFLMTSPSPFSTFLRNSVKKPISIIGNNKYPSLLYFWYTEREKE